MNRRLRSYAIRYSYNFSCTRSWWHRWRNKVTITERSPGGDHCAHEIWACSCGKRWHVDRQWIEGVMHVRAEELKEHGDVREEEA
jgi:hypothetical protein